jgi:hypothetical protein
VVLPGGRAAYLELKSRKGRLSSAQQEFRAACLAAGAVYEVARSTDEAIGVRCASVEGVKWRDP